MGCWLLQHTSIVFRGQEPHWSAFSWLKRLTRWLPVRRSYFPHYCILQTPNDFIEHIFEKAQFAL
jgi:hypothetical protein